jgi:hypothetical protein
VEYQTPRNKVLRGIKPRGTTFKNEYFCNFEKEFKNILGCEFRDYMGSIHRKNQRSEISCYCPFKGFKTCCFKENGRNCLVFAISHWKMILKAFGQLLSTAKRV